MRFSMKKFVAFLLAAGLVFVCIPQIAQAVSIPGDYDFTEMNGEIIITGYRGTDSIIEIPDTFWDKPVRSIGHEAFRNKLVLTSVTIPEGVKKIDTEAFYCCKNLSSVSLPSTLEEIGASSFSDTGLTTVTIPEGVKKIDYEAFYFCKNLSSVSLPSTLEEIGSNSFTDTSLTTITIPAKVSSIGQYAFSQCLLLQSFTVDSANTSFCSIDGVFFDKPITHLLQYPPAKADSEYGIPEGVQCIDNNAFANSKLTSVIFPSSLRDIICYVFDECTNLTNITFNDGFRNIGENAFNNCDKLETINLPASMNYIDMDAFEGCPNITEVNVRPGCANYSSTDGVLYNNTSDSIYYYPIAKQGECKILEGTVWVSDRAFQNSQVDNVVCPASLKFIGCASFMNCKNLQTIEFLSRIQEINSCAFYECNSLKRAIFYGDKPQIGEEAFGLTDKSFMIYYPVAYFASWSGYTAYPCKPYCMFTLDKQDGSAPSTTMAYVTNGHIEKPADPVRADFVFGGWYTEAACTNQWDFNTSVVTGDISLFARWLPATNKVLFNPGAGANVNPESKAVNYGGTYGDLPTPTKPGNLFDGWYTGADGTGTKIIASDTVTITSDITLYAKWLSATYTVTFNPGQGVSVNPASKAVSYGGTYGDLPVPVKAGNLFNGWYTAPDSTGSRVTASDTVTLTSDQTLYARWVAQKQSANLSGISFSAGKLTKAFSSTRTSYTLKLGENNGTVTIIPAKAYSGARMTIGGTSAEKKTVTVANGKTVKVKIVVKNGKLSKTYTISITRAKSTNNRLSSLTASAGTLSPLFAGMTTSYKLLLPASTTKVTLKAARESTLAKISPSSKTIKLKNGQTVKVKFTVRAQSGAVKTYTVTVTRAVS